MRFNKKTKDKFVSVEAVGFNTKEKLKTRSISFNSIPDRAEFIFNGTHYFKLSNNRACVYGRDDLKININDNRIVDFIDKSVEGIKTDMIDPLEITISPE